MRPSDTLCPKWVDRGPRAQQHPPCNLPIVIGFAAVLSSPAATVSEGYCGQRLPISGAGRQAAPYHRPLRHGPRSFTVSVVKPFGGSFVWVIWLAHPVRSQVATTPLAASTPSDHDSPNAPTTARSVYVVAYPAAQPARPVLRFWVVANNICR